jgi:predicted glycosyltransferase
VRILIHAQHLSGVGHRVRALELARRFAAAHDVLLIDGGRPVPRAASDAAVGLLALPRIERRADGLAALDGRPVEQALAERRARLARAAGELAPDVLLVEHYPFSKWELEAEIEAAVAAARAANAGVRVVCSLRDVCPPTRHEHGSREALARRVNEALRARFDAVIVHADARFTRLEEHFAGAGEIEVPVLYSGFVSERRRPQAHAEPLLPGGYAVLSVGGGGGSVSFALRCIEAWKRICAGPAGARTLVVFAGLFWSEEECERVRAAAAGGPVLLRPFAVDLLRWLEAADLSISRAGYNTCTNLLETGCPALVVPHPRMSDQAFRARRLEELGLVEALESGADSEDALAAAMARALRRPRAACPLDLDGAARSERLLEALVAAGPDLLALARERGARLAAISPVTALPSPLQRRAAFALDFEDGARVKGRRVQSSARAERMERLLALAGEGFPRILARRGDALLLEWIPGASLASLAEIPPDVLRRCGERLGALHRRTVGPERGLPVLSVDDLRARLAKDAAALESAGALPPQLARRAVALAREHAPGQATVGLVHRDFCAENIVLDAFGAPVCIDNPSLALGPHDFDLGRSWARWPMSRADRTHFAEGYAKERSLETFLEKLPFWACCALLGSAAKRVRTRTGGEEEPLERLRRLLALAEGSAQAAASAFWVL